MNFIACVELAFFVEKKSLCSIRVIEFYFRGLYNINIYYIFFIRRNYTYWKLYWEYKKACYFEGHISNNFSCKISCNFEISCERVEWLFSFYFIYRHSRIFVVLYLFHHLVLLDSFEKKFQMVLYDVSSTKLHLVIWNYWDWIFDWNLAFNLYVIKTTF